MSSLRVTSLEGDQTEYSYITRWCCRYWCCYCYKFYGDLTGDVTGNADTATNAQGLTGTPNISVGIITATQYVGVPEGTNVLKAMLFV